MYNLKKITTMGLAIIIPDADFSAKNLGKVTFAEEPTPTPTKGDIYSLSKYFNGNEYIDTKVNLIGSTAQDFVLFCETDASGDLVLRDSTPTKSTWLFINGTASEHVVNLFSGNEILHFNNKILIKKVGKSYTCYNGVDTAIIPISDGITDNTGLFIGGNQLLSATSTGNIRVEIFSDTDRDYSYLF